MFPVGLNTLWVPPEPSPLGLEVSFLSFDPLSTQFFLFYFMDVVTFTHKSWTETLYLLWDKHVYHKWKRNFLTFTESPIQKSEPPFTNRTWPEDTNWCRTNCSACTDLLTIPDHHLLSIEQMRSPRAYYWCHISHRCCISVEPQGIDFSPNTPSFVNLGPCEP